MHILEILYFLTIRKETIVRTFLFSVRTYAGGQLKRILQIVQGHTLGTARTYTVFGKPIR
jgi:hypothetical protein